MFGIELEDVKTYLGYTDSSRDPQITLLMNAAFAMMKELTGRNLERAVYRDTIQYHGDKVYAREYPVQEIVSIQRNSQVIPATDYTLFGRSGLIHFRNHRYPQFSSSLAENFSYLLVEYVGGYEQLPADMVLAFYNAVQTADNIQKQNTQFGGTVKRLAVYDVGVTDLAVPREGISDALRSSLSVGLMPYIDRAETLGAWIVKESELVGPYVGSP